MKMSRDNFSAAVDDDTGLAEHLYKALCQQKIVSYIHLTNTQSLEASKDSCRLWA